MGSTSRAPIGKPGKDGEWSILAEAEDSVRANDTKRLRLARRDVGEGQVGDNRCCALADLEELAEHVAVGAALCADPGQADQIIAHKIGGCAGAAGAKLIWGGDVADGDTSIGIGIDCLAIHVQD